MSEVDPQRRAELAGRLRAVHDRIERACAVADRDPGEITLVVVTKTFPAADVVRLVELGVADVGENRDQDAAAKAIEAAAALGAGQRPPRWHFVGQLQRNKAASVARYADVVHSVDRLPLATALGKGAQLAGRQLDVLLQVSLHDPAGGAGRGGVLPFDLAELAAAVARTEGLRLRGVMAVAPLDAPAGPAFARLAELAATLRAEHPQATWMSAGMSGDLEDAVAHGATHLRVGSAVLGSRPSLR
ncbi:YggS family pyridoxal phosphate-dependent enzyme [Angustibacter sp. McL0619]|uniref:YggS family pyridoxal phosphate-dependent enzyme n=1 Tax=Angustibacter sp. McL0619 TaxID=3415676 RepID=UPI003CEA5B1B